MAIDLEALKRKLSSFDRPRSNVKFWKPAKGEHKVRVLAWPDQPADSPIKEFYFYYLGKQQRILAPYQFGMKDPIRDLYNELSRSRDPDDREKRKILEPKLTACYMLIDRAQEDAGPLLWTFNIITYKRLFGLYCKYIEDDGVTYDDVQKGCDFEVKLTASGKMFNGKEVLDTVVDLARKSTPLHKDAKKVDEWTKAIPDMKTHFKPPTDSEVEATFNAWIREDESPAVTAAAPAVTRGGAVTESSTPAVSAAKSELDKVFADLGVALDDKFC